MNKGTTNTLLAAFYSLRVNKLRAIITMLIIALGIASLVGMQTAIEGLRMSLVSNLNRLGNNTFSIIKDTNPLSFSRRRKQSETPEITYRDALKFKKLLNFPANVCLSSSAGSSTKARYNLTETNPNISLTGSDQHYLESNGYELEKGRNFSVTEVERGTNVAIIGRELNNLLFGAQLLGIGKEIFLDDRKYLVIGVTKEKGSTFGMSFDKTAIIPLLSAKKNFSATLSNDYNIKISVIDVFNMNAAIGESIGAMRMVRKLKPGEENNFGITKSENLRDLLDQNLSYVSYAAIIIGLITLSGALIALMNIMFVSVTERTKEIGTRMAVGASAKLIRLQFLSEATAISLVGGIFGILFGLLMGNAVILFLKLDVTLPYQWIAISFVLCGLVGISAGFLPAKKAATLDPIESLRYE